MKTDTICSIATALSDSGIGIIRVSGSDAIEICDKLYQTKNGEKKLTYMKSHTIHYGYIMDGDDIVDEVMVSIMRAPKSYTTEDTVEINCHGGIVMLQKVLQLVLHAGARLAEPGEFTKRAFLNGRIDLTKAEAVMDIIHAKNELARKSGVKQLSGSVYRKIKDIREKLIYEIAFIESALDDPEHISLEGYTKRLYQIIKDIEFEIEDLLSSADKGKIIKNGISTVIVGKPNVGKSSLLNILSGQERAIVTDIAGTTRDILEEQVSIGDIHLNIVDTAGIRQANDIVEQIGVEKAKKYAEDADLLIYVVDSSKTLDENDTDIIKMIKEKKCIILLNKSDLLPVINEEDLRLAVRKEGYENSDNIVIIKTSTKNETGMNELEQTIRELFFQGEISLEKEVYITNLRHIEALKETKTSLQMVKESIDKNMPEDFYSIDLMSAYSSLGSIIGEEVSDDLVNEIFSKFCMGK